jgi:hypothetical protein
MEHAGYSPPHMAAKTGRRAAADTGTFPRRMTLTLDEALLTLNDRLGQEVTAWMEVSHDTPLLIATGILENWSHYSLADARFDLSDPPIESVNQRTNGLTFRFTGGARLVVTWSPMSEEGLV